MRVESHCVICHGLYPLRWDEHPTRTKKTVTEMVSQQSVANFSPAGFPPQVTGRISEVLIRSSQVT